MDKKGSKYYYLNREELGHYWSRKSNVHAWNQIKNIIKIKKIRRKAMLCITASRVRGFLIQT